ncbi:3-hydroxyacyl-CoA dehydrogenase [Brevibacillus sp. HB1.4B]|uniref:3-hydroxyacyl-CoA dehydrogenase n=1 Tax=Brevibacillus sp. HB1.4B TaxID=2738845 RepID=UPI00156AFC3E|nr:3-hydroxyacyl-CoA dehydrogenase [Brevibacillus sp. HB1.4B]NRS15370.1 3-hydroxyacyl-CoA dehydrogenase [Brevibacillus sp. HB1.4B]
MDFKNSVVAVTGGASGLGEATVKSIVAHGGKALMMDVNDEKGTQLAEALGDQVLYVNTNVVEEADVRSALDQAVEKFGKITAAVNCAGIGGSQKTYGKNGPFDLVLFTKIIQVNLIGTFNVIRLAAAKISENEPNEQGERGVIVNTASAAAFEGQMGQAAYSASKGGVVGMTLPIARDLSSLGIRVVTIAPGLFETPMLGRAPEHVKQALSAMVPFPQRLGQPNEFAHLVQSIIENPMLNGEVIRLDGALRMQPK